MKDKPNLKITYNAFQYNFGVEDLNKIEIFKKKLSEEYDLFVKPIAVGRGGESVYGFIIEQFVNLSITEYLAILSRYIAEKAIDNYLVDPILEKYLFTPFKKLFIELKQQNPGLDCYCLSIELINVKVNIYKISENSILEVSDKIITTLSQIIDNFKNEQLEPPSEIHIPVLPESFGDKIIFRPPMSLLDSDNEYSNDDYFKVWGLKYYYFQEQRAYDLVNQHLFDTESFYDADQYLNLKFN